MLCLTGHRSNGEDPNSFDEDMRGVTSLLVSVSRDVDSRERMRDRELIVI